MNYSDLSKLHIYIYNYFVSLQPKTKSIIMRLLIALLSVGLLVLLLSFVNIQGEKDNHFQKKHPLTADQGIKAELPVGFNDLFAGSGECALCHDAITNEQGESISISNDWRSSMMANAAKDPFWRAKVSHEGLVNPQHAEVLEDVCTKCHAPMGHFNAHHLGQSLYSIEEMKNDPLALDGVSCTACHQIKAESLGIYSGNLDIGLDKKIWGQYEAPVTMPMFNHTGYTPEHSNHIKDSKLCGSCHTLLTNSVDLSGVPTGTQFVEQAIFHEWNNSDYSQEGISCQSCHVPEITDNVIIASMPPWLNEERSPFGKHHLAGANVFMLKLMKENMDVLGITADEVHMDSTISRATRMLQENTLSLEIEEIERTNDTLFVDLSLMNMAGHKFPGGYPSRRAYIEVYAINSMEDTIFHSGKMDTDFNLVGEDADFESHYDMINSNQQIQIYEMVMGDVTLSPTTVLERAYIHLKDNRLPPSGFTTSHYSYDTVQIVGGAFEDVNFNKENGNEGTGRDIVHFHIPMYENQGALEVTAKVFYQTVTNRWLENMFTYSSDDIDAFKSYYESADKTPVKVGEVNLVSSATGIPGQANNQMINLYPNPAKDFIYIQNDNKINEIRFYTLQGKLVQSSNHSGIETSGNVIKTRVPDLKGIYMIQLISEEGSKYSQKVIVN